MEAPPPPPPGPPPPAGRQAYPPPPPTTAPPPPPPPPGYTPSQGHEGPPPHHGPKRPPSTGQYRDHRFGGSEEEMEVQLANSTTLYVGNLSFFTTEEQIYELFSRAGEIKRIIMGLDRFRKTPCGFCFAEYYTKEDATACFRFINGTRLDDRTIRTDWDAGFAEGRQYGRGKSGGQVRDEYRTDFDPGRGGYGKQKQLEIEAMEKRRNAVTYLENLSEIPAGGDFSVGASAYRKRSRPPSFSGGGNLPPPPSHYPPAPYSGQGHPPHPASDHDLPPTKRIRDESENPRFRPERSGKESDDEDD